MSRHGRSFRVEAVVLRHWDYGEADRMVELFTVELGKVRAIAKGVRKTSSRKAGHLEPFTRLNLLLAEGRDLYIVTQAETIDAYLPLRDDLLGVGRASYVLELLDRFAYPGEENRAVYRLLTNTLQRLSGTAEPQLVLRYYELSLLNLSGFRPQLFHCTSCEADIQPEDQYFSAERGGVLCPKCGRGMKGAQPISMPALKYLRHLQRSTFAEASRAHPSEEVHREMEMIMQSYLAFVLERSLNTPRFLRQVTGSPTTH